MALSKFVKVRNVGRLTALAAVDDVAFRRLTLVYGDNASGKTTLTAILRSASSGDPAPVKERATLGATASPEVTILADSTEHRFVNGAWSTTLASIEIFDDTFVRDNVYAGDSVDKEQRRNLYDVVVGPTAVALARRIDELDSESRAVSRVIRETEGRLHQLIQAPFSIDEFLRLRPEPNATERIASLTRELSAARNAAAIVSRPQLGQLLIPASPRPHLTVLRESYSEITEDASTEIRQHIASSLDERGEAWLRQGLGYHRNHSCPFCAQGTADVPLVSAYETYFSASYESHVVRIQRAINDLEQSFSAERFAALERIALENMGRIHLWADLVDLSRAAVNLDRFQAVWQKLQSTMLTALRRKLANPSIAAHENGEIEAALQDYEAEATALDAGRLAINDANAAIAEVKTSAARGNEDQLERELRRLRNSQIRQEPAVASLCDELSANKQRKATVDQEKARTRQDLVGQAEALLASYEGDINRLLGAFGASFRLTGTTPSFAGGRASSTYKLALNNVLLDVGDATTPPGVPCFRSVLSAGDKSTLALAFFLAKLERDPQIAERIVILDDPLTSLDAFRTSFTQQYITRLAERALQVIVLSHDAFFLKGIADLHGRTLKTLRLARSGGTFTLKPWDVSHHCLAEAHKDYLVLRTFIEDGLPEGSEPITVARAIRPYVEGYLRHRFPDRFAALQTLGDLVQAIRDAAPSDELAVLKPRLDDLEDLNVFSRRVHHGAAGGRPTMLSEEEVRTFAERAIAFVRR